MPYIGLTKQQEDYCYAYVFITDFDANAAMQIAQYSTSTEKVINETKRELMRNPKIRKRIADLIHEREEDDLIDKAFVIEKLKKVINETNKGVNYNAHLKALELLGKHLGMFTDKQTEVLEDKDPSKVAKELFERRRGLLKPFKKEGDKNDNNEKLVNEAVG